MVPIKPLFSAETIAKRVSEIADEISAEYSGGDLVLVCALKGAFYFCSDLSRKLTIPHSIEFIRASSYGSGKSSNGNVTLTGIESLDLSGRDILLVEDIIDTGHTASSIINALRELSPNSVQVCTFLDKPSRRNTSIIINHSGYRIGDYFVVGYGMDYNESYRELNYIGTYESG